MPAIDTEPRLTLVHLPESRAQDAKQSSPGSGHGPRATGDGAGASTIPADFGAENGTEVSNKQDVFKEIDRLLHDSKPPALEYILVMPFSVFRLPFQFGISYNSFGHAAVRYTMPSGEQKVMNIAGKKPGLPMVHFTTPEHYLFSTAFSPASEQRGLYNRAMIGVRIETLPDEQIIAMDSYFASLLRQEQEQQAKFDIVLFPLYNFLRWLLPSHIAERGNCAFWTSKGLKEAGVLQSTSMWPKSIFIHLFENSAKYGGKENVHVVSYRRIKHAKLSYGVDAEPVTAVAPLQSLRSVLYWNLEKFANAVVEVPPNTVAAVVRENPSAAGPSFWRNLSNNKLVIFSSAVITGAVIFRYNKELTRRTARSLASLTRWRQPRKSGRD